MLSRVISSLRECRRHFSLIMLLVLIAVHVDGQDSHVNETNEVKRIENAVAFSLGVIALPRYDFSTGEHIGEVLVPAFSLDYELWYKHKFGVLLMNEYVLSSFVAHDNFGDIIERDHILITAITFGFSPIDHLAGFIGYGLEIDLGNGVSYSVLKMGTEYSIPIRNGWHSVLLLTSDIRTYYASASFEIGFAKTF